jgi:hypothetical protein
MPVDLSILLDMVAGLAHRSGLAPDQVVTAQSLAWYYATRYEERNGSSDDPLPPSHWARLAVRATRNGRDLPGCGTSVSDALHRCWQGAGMPEARDPSPGPDVQAADREQLERTLAKSPQRRRVAELRIAGASNREVAEELGVSPSRTSQIAREIAEDFRR